MCKVDLLQASVEKYSDMHIASTMGDVKWKNTNYEVSMCECRLEL